nr:GGDEF domain-containing protein [uncultured Rhodoferax sp.]
MHIATDLGNWLRTMSLVVLVLASPLVATATELSTVDALLAETSKYLYSAPEKALDPLKKLAALQTSFTAVQNERYHLSLANSLGFRGQHAQRVALVQSFIRQASTPGRRASFLYELIDGYTSLGQYEEALQAMNESIALLPVLVKTGDKITVLQGSVATTIAFEDYDVALDFAQRIYELRGADKPGAYAACVGLTDKVELHFMRGASAQARALLQEAIDVCKANENLFFVLINKSNAAVDQINTGDYAAGIANALPLFDEHAGLNQGSDYVTQLEEAVARAYLQLGNTQRAAHFGLKAYRRAQVSKILAMQVKTSKTMAAIQQAKGDLRGALEFYDAHLALRKQLMDDRLQRNLAYQRVRFDSQDRANQLALLEEKNRSLLIDQALQQGRYQNLVLVMTLGLLVLAIVAAWLLRTLQLKNRMRRSAQVDGLTQVINREHFIASARKAFRDVREPASLVLFDMDVFKAINDTYGHATGDWVLRTVCDTVQQQLPHTALLGRLGGEEFAICLPRHPSQEAFTLAERCRAAIAEIGAHPSGLNLEIRASFGVATSSIHGPTSFEETLAAADKALYVSKNEGRNRVTAFQPSGAHST